MGTVRVLVKVCVLLTLLWIYVFIHNSVRMHYMARLIPAIFSDESSVKDEIARRVDTLRSECLKDGYNQTYYAIFSDESSVKDEIARRVDTLRSECLKDGYNQTYYGQYVLKLEHKILFCPVAKVGSTFWLRILKNVTANATDVDPKTSLEYKSSLARVEHTQNWHPVYRKFANFTRIIFTREPYSRLFSAYVDKLLAPNEFYWHFYGKNIAKKIRRGSDAKFLKCGHNATFAEFIKYIIKTYEGKVRFDVHIVPVTWHCGPCVTRYDFIGKMETFVRDASYVMKTHRLGRNVDERVIGYKLVDFRMQIASTVHRLYDRKLMQCTNMSESVRRIWDALKIRGKIYDEIPPPDARDLLRNGEIDVSAWLREADLAFEKSRGKKRERSRYRETALIEAYKTVPLEDKLKIAEIYHYDFVLFSYELYPKKIFGKF